MKKQIIGIGLAVVLGASYMGAKVYAANVATEKVDKAIVKAKDYAQIKYDNVSVDLVGLDVRIADVVVSPLNSNGKKFHINEIVIYDFDKESEIPAVLDLAINGINLEIEQQDAKKIKELGYSEDILLNFALKLNYDNEAKELNLKNLSMGADDMGKIDVAIKISGVDFSSKNVMMAALNPKLSLLNASISYHDDSLADRLFKQAAKEEKVSVEDLKTKITGMMQQEADREEDAFIKSAMQATITFINNPKSFSISMNPEKPFPVGNLMQLNEPKEAIKLLNIEIKS